MNDQFGRGASPSYEFFGLDRLPSEIIVEGRENENEQRPSARPLRFFTHPLLCTASVTDDDSPLLSSFNSLFYCTSCIHR